MATILEKSNSVYNYSGGYIGYYFYLEVILNSQSIPNNTSNITVNHYGQANTYTGGGYSGFTSPTSEIVVQGTSRRSGQCSNNIPTSGTKVLLGTWTGNIAHNSDGTLQLNVSATYEPNDSIFYLPQSNTLSGSTSVQTIPRSSSVSVSDYTISSALSTDGISYTVTSQASFYHKANWTLNASSSTVTLGLINGTSTKKINNQALLGKMPTLSVGTLSITIETYADSEYTNLIGTETATCTVTVDGSVIKPTVTLPSLVLNTRATGVDSSITSLVAGYTSLKTNGSWARTLAYGTTGATVYFSINRATLSVSSSTAASGTITSSMLPPSDVYYKAILTAYAIDSRGIQSDVVTSEADVFGYQAPNAEIIAHRVANGTSTDEDATGQWAYIAYSGAIKSTVNNQNSVVSTTCTYSGSKSGTVSTNPYWLALDVGENITVSLTVQDKVSSTTITQDITVARYPLDLADDGSGAVGVGLGTLAEYNMVKFGLNAHFYSDKYFIYHTANDTAIAFPNGQVVASTRGSVNTISELMTMADDIGVNIAFTCSPTISLTNTLSGYSQTGILIGKKVDGSDRFDYMMMAGNGSSLVVGTIVPSTSTVSYKSLVFSTDIYYKSGDTITIAGDLVLVGQVSGRVVSFFLPLEKRLTNISSVTITALTLTLRGASGYINNMTASGVDFTDASYTKTVSIRGANNGLYITITFPSAIANLVNNSPVSVYVQSLGLTLN